ncbi:hypothetical protein C8J57DRAFT_1515760 [Mycena rebaudengoi]|nr:hypothetical protein C8J57DRAFT_1515760 [Mycena rebaudengoi]
MSIDHQHQYRAKCLSVRSIAPGQDMQFARLASFLILAFTTTALAAPGVDNLAKRCCTCSLKREIVERSCCCPE